jgi:AcrR family transcriptional regulator
MDHQGAAHAERTDAGTPGREALLAAMLALSGELGYRRATLKAIATRSGRPAGYLYTQFAGREECFVAAYESRAQPLVAAMLTAGCESGSLAEGLHSALGVLLDLADADPLVARALVIEVYVVGGAARHRHDQLLRRLSDAVAGTRRESPSSRHVPPPLAAEFIVGGLEEVVRRRLLERRPDLLRAELPALATLAAGTFEGS